jgi:DNA sulfur modification protein DndD
MFEFLTLHLSNFALYNDLMLDLSPRPGSSGPNDLVLIRGHNEHGKTTLFRGLMWTVFGAEGLGRAEHLSARDVMRLQGQKGPQEHVGQLIFKSESTKYRITRTAITREDSLSVDERVRVHRYSPTDSDNPWKDEPSAQKSLAELYFPPPLAPYLFLNADKVYTIVGDVANLTRQTDEVTQAINDMLGITAVEKAVERVKQQRRAIHNDLSRKLGKDSKKDELEADVLRLEREVEEQKATLRSAGERIELLNGQLQARESELKVFEEGDDATAVYTRLEEAKHARGLAVTAYRDAMKELRADFGSQTLYVPFFTKMFAKAQSRLQHLHVEGVIPQTELPLLTKLLNPVTNVERVCICGETDISPGTKAHTRLTRLVEASRAFEEGADRLDKIRGDLDELLKAQASHHRDWAGSFSQRVRDVKETKDTLGNAQSLLDDVERERDEYENDATQEQIRLLREEVNGIRDQLSNAKTQQNVAVTKLTGGLDLLDVEHGIGLEAKLDGAHRKLSNYYSTIKDAQHLTQAVKAAEKVIETLNATIRSIQRDQVAAVSAHMNHLFLTITNNGAEVATDESGHMSVTSHVGIREVTARAGRFELYAETASGDSKPLALLNGASRQALTVAFMVALLENSDAPIPLVTDSLFHPLSGNVKFRLAKHLLTPRVQKITFFTHDDVQNLHLRNLLMQHAARAYTVSNSGKASDLANPPQPNSAVAMVCTCGPDEYCETCELAVHDGDSPTHSLRHNSSSRRVL